MSKWLTLLFVLLPYTLESADEPARMPSEWKVDMERPDWYHHRDLTFRWDDTLLEVEGWGGECWIMFDFTPRYGERHWVKTTERNTEWGFTFYERPQTNRFRFPMYHDGVQFLYQHHLSDWEKADGCYRPDSVEGSWALYHDNCANDFDNRRWDESYEEYRVGKFTHIYRPLAFAGADTLICALDIRPEEDYVVIIVPQAWIDTAQLPIVIDPNFGYDTDGASYHSGPCGSGWSMGCLGITNGPYTYTASTGDQVTKTFVKAGSSNATESTYVALYETRGASPDSLKALHDNCVDYGIGEITVGNPTWDSSADLTKTLTNGTTYAVACTDGTTGAMGVDYDTGGSRDAVANFSVCADPFAEVGGYSEQVSMYARYSTGGGGADSTIIGVKP